MCSKNWRAARDAISETGEDKLFIPVKYALFFSYVNFRLNYFYMALVYDRVSTSCALNQSKSIKLMLKLASFLQFSAVNSFAACK